MIIIGLDGFKFRNFERIMKNCIFVIAFLLSRKGSLSYDQISMPCECVGSSPVAGSRDYSTIL